MLQIITGKFYPPGERYETLHRAVFYTNYRDMRGTKLETPVGVLLPSTGMQSLASFTCEMIEKQPKHPDGKLRPGLLIATGGHELLNDFAAVISFVLNVTCSPDESLVRRLLATERPSLNVEAVPSKFIQRTFDKEIFSKDSEAEALSAFITQLVGLERKRFDGAMRAIRRFVTGTHRIADELSLAYALFVMSIESLAQEFDGHVAEWADYDQSKRVKIDAALSDAAPEVVTKVHDAILSNEHVALSRRFRDFAMDHIEPSFFREEAAPAHGPLSRTDLAIALQQAYSIRSGYVHSLKPVPPQLAMQGFPEAMEIDGRATLTFAGLSRVARHIITRFVKRGIIVEKEEFNYRLAIPGIVSMPLDPQYWIANANGFTHELGPSRLTAFLGQWTSAVLLNSPNAKFTDIRPLLEKIEEIVPGLRKPSQRLPMTTMYLLFHQILPPDQHLPKFQEFMDRYKDDFVQPSVESFAAHFLTGQNPDWNLDQYEELHAAYFKSRRTAKVTNLGRMIEAAFSLHVAELNRVAGNDDRSRKLVAFAVEAYPGHAALRAFEAAIGESVPEIDWEKILLPPKPPKASDGVTPGGSDGPAAFESPITCQTV